MSKDFCLNINH